MMSINAETVLCDQASNAFSTDEVDSTDCHSDLVQDAPASTPQASSIQAIDKGSVHRICSGQVVLTLATAVKELVENSIDAGATSVEVKLKDYGSESIEVIDNGSGVEESNFEGLTLKHHTSKLQDFDDLVSVTTFGFRGEALSSLCALSNMVITTRNKFAAVGTRLEFDLNGKIVSRKSAPRQVGTTVHIQNIFHTLPVRHKEFHRNLKKEFAKLVQVLNAYCIVNTGVRISCSNQTAKGSRNIVVSTNGNESMKENIANIFSPKQLQSLLEFCQAEAEDEVCTEFGIKSQQKSAITFRMEGFISKCEHGQGRSSSDRQFIFINKRPCDAGKILKLINEVYHSYNRHQNPFIALNITMNKESVDVNVTPDKRQIFLEGERLLLAVLKSSLIQMFEPTTSIYKVNSFSSSLQIGSRSSTSATDSPRTLGKLESFSQSDHGVNDSVTAPSLSSSLSRMKRSFTSAFAKTCPSPGSNDKSPNKKSKDLPASLAGTRSRSLPSQISSSDRGSITQFLSRFSPKKSLSTPASTSSTAIVTMHELSSPVRSNSDLTVFSSVSSTPDVFSSTDSDHILENSISHLDAESCGNNELQTHNSDVKVHVEQEITKDLLNGENTLTNSASETVEEDIGGKIHLNRMVCEDSKVIDPTSSSQEPSSQETVRESAEGESTEQTENPYSTRELTDKNLVRPAVVTDQDLQEEGEDVLKKREQRVTFSLSCLKEKMEQFKIRENGSTPSFSRSFRAQICPTDNQSAEDELQREISKDMFAKMEILGQFNLGFIITKLGSDLFIVDQHATDEKYNFEMLQRHTVLHSQKMIIPQSLELTASNETILVDNLDVFKKNGFDFVIDQEAPPTQRIKLVSAPVSKNWSFGKDDIEELLFMLTDSPNVMCRPTRVRMMFASRACRKSIMIGTALNKSEMRRLVCHMGEIEQPWNCPHGRPTMRHLFNMKMLPS